jgi:hypothetical protein
MMTTKAQQIKGVMLTGTTFAIADLTARFECSDPNVFAHLAALRKAGHEFEKIRGDDGRNHYRYTGQAAVVPPSTEVVVVSNGTPKKRGLQEAMLGTEPFTLADMAARHQAHVVWVTKVRRQLQTQGHHYTRSIANHIVTFCHVPDRCAPGLHSMEITTTTAAAPKPVKREGGGTVSGAARLPFSPSLDAQMVTTMLRRQPDGSLLMAFSDGDNEYVVQHVGTLPLGEMSL